MKKKEKMIRELIRHDANIGNGLPEDYRGFRGVTRINYGYMGRKHVNIDDVKEYLEDMGFNRDYLQFLLDKVFV